MSDPVAPWLSYKEGRKTAKATKKATEAALALQREMWETAREDIKPWMTAGKAALTSLEGLIKKGPGEFRPEEDPGYKFGYEEFVEKPTLRGAAARGGLRSGATEKALTRYASDYASTKYDNFLNRYYNKLRPYQSVAGLGQTSAAQTAALGTATGASMAQNYLTGNLNAINARLAGYSGLASGLSSGGANALSYYSSLRQPATTPTGGGAGATWQPYTGVGR